MRFPILAFAFVAACGSEPIRAERIPNQLERLHVERVDAKRGMIARRPEVVAVAPAPRFECELGQHGPPCARVGQYSVCVAYNGGTRFTHCPNTPLVVAWDDEPIEFTQASADFHVGNDDRTEWVSPRTPWLALDRDGSGCIESERELFAGFEPLALLDSNHDGVLDKRDPAFAELVLWSDRNQDKRCTSDEIAPLGIPSIDLAHDTRAPQFGSYESATAALPGGHGRIVDVILAPLFEAPAAER